MTTSEFAMPAHKHHLIPGLGAQAKASKIYPLLLQQVSVSRVSLAWYKQHLGEQGAKCVHTGMNHKGT